MAQGGFLLDNEKMAKNFAPYWQSRRDTLRQRAKESGLDGYLTFDFSDVRYLTGFPSEGCFVLVTSAGDFVFSPLLLYAHLQTHCASDKKIKLVCERLLLDALQKTIAKQSLKKIGFDSAKVTVSLWQSLTKSKEAEFVPLESFVLKQRMVKDAAEIELIAKACKITHESSAFCLAHLRAGVSEEALAHQLEQQFYDRGSRQVAFETIVAFGGHASYPHHVLTSKKLKKSSVVLMDLGCQIDGYKSDLTRTGYFGKMSGRFREIYSVVLQSQLAGIAAVRAGVTAGSIDAVCREVIAKAGYGDYFIHGTGHGVGLDIHEPPRLGIGSAEILAENMVVTVEPGIYLPGEFGVRIEDSVLVGKQGCKILTASGSTKIDRTKIL